MSISLREFVEGFSPAQNNAIMWSFYFYDYAVPIQPPPPHAFQQKIDLGPPLGDLTISCTTQEQLESSMALCLARKDQVISIIANHAFEKLFLRPTAPCTLPDRAAIMEKKTAFPVFGLLVSYHDMHCTHCDNDDEHVCLERRKDEELVMAELSPEAQTELIFLALRFFDLVFDKEGNSLAAVPALEPDDETSMVSHKMEALLHPEGYCAIAESLSYENIFWLGEHPYFGGQVLFHAETCPLLAKKLFAFETDMLEGLTEAERLLYHQLAIGLAGKDYLYEPTVL